MAIQMFGHIPGIDIGTPFSDRSSMSAVGLHRPPQAGISGNRENGAESIVVSGGYVDDIDLGSTIIYTGQGGQDPITREIVQDQELKLGNLALVVSCERNLPVRVIRGHRLGGPYAPSSGYRYDGLYRVMRYWLGHDKNGFGIWRFELQGIPGQHGIPGSRTSAFARQAPKVEVGTTEVVTTLAKLYRGRCQVCGTRLEGASGPVVIASFLRPLSQPHNGSPGIDNAVSVCPNHRLLLRIGKLKVLDDYQLLGWHGRLEIHRDHGLEYSNIRYHREVIAGFVTNGSTSGTHRTST